MRKEDISIFFDRKVASAFDDLFDLLPELFTSYKKDEKSVSWVQKNTLSYSPNQKNFLYLLD